MIVDFFSPYVQLIIGMAYNIQQALEGGGISLRCPSSSVELGSPFVSFIAPAVCLDVITAALLFYVLVLVGLLLLCGYILARRRGLIISAILVLLPGLLNLGGLLPAINVFPGTIYLGDTRALGSSSHFAILMLLTLLTGWSVTIIAYDLFSLSNRFRNYYDHFWYCSIIITGVFFVYNASATRVREELARESFISQRASLYLARSLEKYHAYCEESGILNSASCSWSSSAQQVLNEYAIYSPNLFISEGPKDDLDIYFPLSGGTTKGQALEIREQIKAYNNAKCPVTKIDESTSHGSPASLECQRPPAEFCTAFPSPPEGFVVQHMALRTVALASECIVPMLVQSREKQRKLSLKMKSSMDDLRLRWVSFLLLSFVAGGKIANVTSKIAAIDERKRDQKRIILRAICRIGASLRKSIGWLQKVFLRVGESVASHLRRK